MIGNDDNECDQIYFIPFVATAAVLLGTVITLAVLFTIGKLFKYIMAGVL